MNALNNRCVILSRTFAFAAAIALAASASAANISWNSPVAITTNGSASDVVNPGVTVEAQYADGGGAGVQTVHGVTFQEGFTNYASPGGATAQALQGFTTNNAAYDTVLNGFAYDGNNPNLLTITGLTVGRTYDVQVWGMDNRGCCGSRTESFTGGLNTSTTFALNSDVSITGKFVADATSQVIAINGVAQGQTNLNAFAVTTAPKPSSFILCGLGVAGMLLAARRRRNG